MGSIPMHFRHNLSIFKLLSFLFIGQGVGPCRSSPKPSQYPSGISCSGLGHLSAFLITCGFPQMRHMKSCQYERCDPIFSHMHDIPT
jgi:hypothetical protein